MYAFEAGDVKIHVDDNFHVEVLFDFRWKFPAKDEKFHVAVLFDFRPESLVRVRG